MEDVDRRLSADTVRALNVPFSPGTNTRNSARTVGGERVRPNDSVELQDGSFMRVIFITEDNDTGTMLLHGIRMLRNGEVDKLYSEKLRHYLKALLPCDDPNEVCAIIKTTADTADLMAFLVTEPIRKVKHKRKIIITNVPRTWGQNDNNDNNALPRSEVAEVLYCRYKYVERADIKNRKVAEFQLRRVTREESDLDHKCPPWWLFHDHRAGEDRYRDPESPYTYGDVCAGGGGTSRAAELAKLTLRFLLDNEANACATLRLNFGAEVVLEMDVCDFCQLKESGLVVDVVHISYICCPHSAANRGENPERNAVHIALGYTLPDILRLCKPRIVTMEQVLGIEKRSDDGQHLRSYIQALTESGYDCRWRVVDLQEYANAQARKRIIIMAACPGQILPSWPDRTNGVGPRLLKPVTISDALLLVPEQEDLPAHMLQHTYKPNAVHPDAKKPLPSCITTSGGKSDTHPYEKRSFNMAELAALNGFPAWHQFPPLGKTALRKLIGNAVPANSFKMFFDKVVEALKETDKENDVYERTEGYDLVQ